MSIKRFDFLIVLFTVLVSGSLYYSSLFKNVFLIPLLLMLALYFLNRHKSNNKRNLNINRQKLLLFLLATLLAVSNLNTVFSSLMVLLACMVCALIITEMISFDDFTNAYIKITLFLSVASWLYFPVLLFHIPSPLPDFISLVDTPYSNFIFFGIYRAEHATALEGLYHVDRNSGIFWEPGAFQIFVNTAFYLTIIRNELSRKRFLIFLVTILTMGSSTGMLVFGLFCTVYFSRTKKSRTARKNASIIVIAIIFSGVFVASKLFSSTLEKFQEGSSSNVSFIARSSDYLIDTNILIDHLWRGVGYGNIAVREKYGIDMMGDALYWSGAQPPGADGLLLFLSYVGILGVVVVWRLIYPGQIRNWSWFEKGLVLVAMVMMYNNENMQAYLFPWVMMFYGFSVHSKLAGVNIECKQRGIDITQLVKAQNV